MSAADAYGRLWWALWDNYRASEKKAIIDAFVHELAEKQRAHLRSQGYDLDCICGGCSACLATEYIDLIDPKKESSG